MQSNAIQPYSESSLEGIRSYYGLIGCVALDCIILKGVSNTPPPPIWVFVCFILFFRCTEYFAQVTLF